MRRFYEVRYSDPFAWYERDREFVAAVKVICWPPKDPAREALRMIMIRWGMDPDGILPGMTAREITEDQAKTYDRYFY